MAHVGIVAVSEPKLGSTLARGQRRMAARAVDRYVQELRLVLEQVGERRASPVVGYDSGGA